MQRLESKDRRVVRRDDAGNRVCLCDLSRLAEYHRRYASLRVVCFVCLTRPSRLLERGRILSELSVYCRTVSLLDVFALCPTIGNGNDTCFFFLIPSYWWCSRYVSFSTNQQEWKVGRSLSIASQRYLGAGTNPLLVPRFTHSVVLHSFKTIVVRVLRRYVPSRRKFNPRLPVVPQAEPTSSAVILSALEVRWRRQRCPCRAQTPLVRSWALQQRKGVRD
jgi:hypothetical protein